MNPIEQIIGNHPKLGLKRKIVFRGIAHVKHAEKEMETIWQEIFLNELDEEIIDPSINNRIIRYYINNNNIVNIDGIVITFERVLSQMTQRVDETYEEFLIRVENVYKNQLENGTPQFNYWANKIFVRLGIEEMLTSILLENKIDNPRN